MIPTRLEDWTLDDVRALAASGPNENDVYDFKADLQRPPENQGKIVSAFANTRGGFLIFGVTDKRIIEGVANTELPRDLGNSLSTCLEPSVDCRFREPFVLPSGRLVFVVEVPRSPRAPHAVFVNQKPNFLKRTTAGTNEAMSYEEIRMAFQDTETRRNKLVHLASELRHIESLARTLIDKVPVDAPVENQPVIDEAWLTRYPSTAIDLLLGDAVGMVSAQTDFWIAMQVLRAEIQYSNAMASAHSDYQFIRNKGDSATRAKLYTFMRHKAQSIAVHSRNACERLDASLRAIRQ